MRKDRFVPPSSDELAVIDESTSDSVAQFAESYSSFNRIINNLQRQYLDLKGEFGSQNEQLADANRKLQELTRKHITANEFLAGVLNSITAGIIAVDQNGIITHFNPASSMLFGLAGKEAVGQHYRDIVPPGQPNHANALRAIEAGREVDSVEKEIVLDDGTHLCLSVSTAIIRDDEGRSGGAVEVLHDLTKLKRMEMEIARLNTLAALGEMAATIAHEVRNPLAGISGFAGLLKRDISEDDPRRKLVTKITHGVDSLNKTITSLLAYTRIDEVKREETVLDDFLRRTVEQYRYDHAEQISGVDITLQSLYGNGTASFKLVIDPLLMRQCFFNLFANAVRACGGEGALRVEYGKLPRQKAVKEYSDKLILGLDETVVEINVIDTGPGIPTDSIAKLFTPFYSTSSGGTGLGLAMVWKIIKSHGGEILATNGEEGGARFTILLPAKINSHDTVSETAKE